MVTGELPVGGRSHQLLSSLQGHFIASKALSKKKLGSRRSCEKRNLSQGFGLQTRTSVGLRSKPRDSFSAGFCMCIFSTFALNDALDYAFFQFSFSCFSFCSQLSLTWGPQNKYNPLNNKVPCWLFPGHPVWQKPVSTSTEGCLQKTSEVICQPLLCLAQLVMATLVLRKCPKYLLSYQDTGHLHVQAEAREGAFDMQWSGCHSDDPVP